MLRTKYPELEFSCSFDDATQTLIVYGIGDMPSYRNSMVPWFGYKVRTQRLIITDGITSVSEKAFSGFENLTEVYVSSSCMRVEPNSFGDAKKLNVITIMESPENLLALEAADAGLN